MTKLIWMLVASVVFVLGLALMTWSGDKSPHDISDAALAPKADTINKAKPVVAKIAEKKEAATVTKSVEVAQPITKQPAVMAVKKQEAPKAMVAKPAAKMVEKVSKPAPVAKPKPMVAALDGRALFSTCSGCHGSNGEGGVGPNLQALSEKEAAAKLIRYKAGEHIGPMSSMMVPQARALSNEEINALAKYIATL